MLFRSAPRKLVSKYGKESDSLKNCTIIIPNEYLSNGFSKEIFDVIPNKKFMSIKEIGQMINDNNTKNTALFEAYRGIQSVSVRVLSVNSGNLFYGNDSGYPIFGDQVSTVDKISEKEMSKLIKEFVKFYN